MNRKYFQTIPVAACALFLLDLQNASALQLVKQGQPRASIVVAKAADPQVRRAALTLQTYIFKSSGARLPIVASTKGAAIHVGPSFAIKNLDRKKLDLHGFVMGAIDARNYYIVGGSGWGTEFGVFDFLERYLGVRWLFPGDIGTDIPRRLTIDIPDARVADKPVFISRQFSPLTHINGNQPPELWARHNRMKPRIRFHHNLLHLFPVEKYGKTHPEFYPILNGKRYIPSTKYDEKWQPNLAAPGIVDAAVAEIEDFFRRYPNETTFSLGMNDSNNWDESPESKARRNGKSNFLGFEDVSDDYFEFANAVVEKVLKRHPDKWFGTLAYHGIVEPPTRVKVHPRIVPFLTYDRMRWEDPKGRAYIQKVTQQWTTASPNVAWYDYAYGMSYQLPRVYPHTMQQYLSWGATHQVKFSYAEIYPNWGEGPKQYVFARLLWNPHQDVDALLDDWYLHCAGPKAAPRLKEYYAIWEKFWTKDALKTVWATASGEFLRFDEDPSYLLAVPPSSITRADAAMQAAVKLADTPQRKARVGKLNQMWQFYKTSVLAYQGANELTKHSPQTEEQVLTSIGEIERVMLLTQKRRDIIDGFQRDELFKKTGDYINAFPATNGKNWGTSLLWQLLPWIEKSPRVTARLQQMANESGAKLGEQGAFIEQMAAGKVKLMTANPSFENGSEGWGIWDKSGEGPQFHAGEWLPSTKNVFEGEKSFLVRGLQRGGMIQEFPYQAGKYFVLVRSFVPNGSKHGTAIVNLETTSKDNELMGGAFAVPFASISLQPGSWGLTAVPFTLPPNNGNAKSFRMHILIDGFQPDGEIYLDGAGIYRVDE